MTLAAAAARRSAASLRSLLPGERWPIIRAILVGPVVALVVGVIVFAFEPSATEAAATIAWLAATATALAGWLTRTAGQIADKVAVVDKAEAKALKTLAEAQEAVHLAELAAAQAAKEVSAAELEAQEAAHELAAAQQKAAADGPGDLLVEYLEGRRTSEDYRSQLGLIGTVWEDLELISDAVAKHNDGLADDDVVNRVVLYVDDLDRCPPDVVVKVLEAVHLLLSYPLFVVVVAVDPHWVSKSLATVYPTLLSGSDVTPDNYLEKIFQLPLWLDPPSADAATAMALALVGSPDGDAAGGPGAEPQPDANRGRPEVPVPRAAVEAGGEQAPVRVERATAPPESVVVHEDERQALGRLAPLLRRSPRALKRYLNTYRLIKAVISPGELAQARFLLAVTIGRPDLGEDLVETVKASPDEATLGSIVDQAPVTRAWVQEAVPTVLEWRDYRSGDLKSLIPQVQRFVFRASDLPEKEPLAVLLRRTDDLLVDGQA